MDLLQTLKDRTRPHHDRIEDALNPMRSGLTRADYAALLCRFYGFHAAWEDRAAAHFVGEDWPFFDNRRKAHLIAADLRFLGLPAAEITALPRCDALPPLDTFADALGSMYVLEGATLGGQHISRHLGRTLELRPDAGCAFFASYGDRVGLMWREFQRYLLARAVWQEEAVIAAAAATFDALHQWMTDEPAPSSASPALADVV